MTLTLTSPAVLGAQASGSGCSTRGLRVLAEQPWCFCGPGSNSGQTGEGAITHFTGDHSSLWQSCVHDGEYAGRCFCIVGRRGVLEKQVH